HRPEDRQQLCPLSPRLGRSNWLGATQSGKVKCAPMSGALLETSLPLPLARRGKVRDVYDLGESFLFVATDRISAFDVVLSPGIPDKGKILTQMSTFWFHHFGDVENHLLETEWDAFPSEVRAHGALRGRS